MRAVLEISTHKNGRFWDAVPGSSWLPWNASIPVPVAATDRCGDYEPETWRGGYIVRGCAL